jgi:hypothetical protein
VPVLKMANYVEFYRHVAESSDSHVLSGRGERILQALDLAPDDTLLDIGCGDSCWLRMAEGRVSQRVALSPMLRNRTGCNSARQT